MSSSIKIVCNLNPPVGVESNGLEKSRVHDFPIQASTADGQKRYYAALQASIVAAKEKIGNELTAWRDVVGKAELTKEPKQVKSDEADEEEEGEEDQ